jgi:hypothetical protein
MKSGLPTILDRIVAYGNKPTWNRLAIRGKKVTVSAFSAFAWPC